MLLFLIIILILIWAAVVSSIYWSFMVFYSNFSESENYHKAYYTAISALERWELVVKQHQPGYEWYGWLKLWQGTWSYSNGTPDNTLTNFSYLWDYNEKQISILRKINSKTSRIPKENKWNIEKMLAAEDSKNYNMMDYENAEVFLMYCDTSNIPYAKSNSLWSCAPTKISWTIRLPRKLLLSWWFQALDTSIALMWRNEATPPDDAIVDRQIRWIYNSTVDSLNYPFTIYSTQDIDRATIDNSKDSIFRESDLNNNNGLSWLVFEFSKDRWNPITNTPYRKKTNPITIIGQKESEMKILSEKFKKVFERSSNLQLRFSLLNLLQDRSKIKVYPFLEYYIDFNWTSVPDKYFTINGEWNYSDYQVNIIRKIPTVKETVLSNFTSIID